MSGHTPGPWVILRKRVSISVVSDINGDYITENVRALPNQDANARLIAAAPELLAAAKLQVQNYERQNLHPDVNFIGDEEHDCWRKLNEAIAKATGESK